MKCPECGASPVWEPATSYKCAECGWTKKADFIDRAELKRLVVAADNREQFTHSEIFHALEKYLSGDPEPLRVLAGEKE